MSAAVYDDGTLHFITNDLNTANLIIGDEQSDNELVITNNALLVVTKAVNVGQSQSSTNNRLTVSSGSVLASGAVDTGAVAAVGTGGIFMGNGGVLNAANQSYVSADYLYTGFNSNDTSAAILLNSTGTVLNISQDAYIGYAGSGSTVTIQDGAELSVNTLTVGTLDNSNNAVNVNAGGILSGSSDASIVVINNLSLTNNFNQVNVNAGGTLRIAGNADYSMITNQGVTIRGGATLEVGGTLTDADYTIDEGIAYRLNDAIGTNTAFWDTGVNNEIYIGSSADNNRLEIAGGTVQTADTIYLGYLSSSDSNELTVEGAGSRLITSNSVTVGLAGDGNAIRISSGGAADIGGSLRIGQNSGSANNSVAVSGTGSTLTVAGNILVGNFGSGNSLTVSSNGTVSAQSDLIVGANGNNNQLSVLTNGTVQVADDLTIGQNGNSNSSLVKGTNATLTVQNALIVGEYGSANSLTVSDQGRLSVGTDLIAGAQSGSNNAITVTGSNSILAVAGNIRIGDGSSGNRLMVTNQAAAYASNNLYVGAAAVSNNTVLVTGTGALLSVSGDIHLGTADAVNNTVDVRNGGALFMGGGIIAGDGSNNVISINSGGMLKVVDWDFTTASTSILFKAGATLGVGGTLANTTNTVDFGRFTLILDGTIVTNDSVWDAGTNTITVGKSSGTNTLAAQDGGRISASNIMVGSASSSAANKLLVAGTNAQLTVGGDLTIGQGSSSRNSFSVGTNGTAFVGRDLIAGDSANNNEIQVGDADRTNSYGVSQLTVGNHLLIGRSGGSANTLTLYNDGSVFVSNEVQIGQGANNNGLTVNGSNAVLDVTGNLIVGDDTGSGNTLEILAGTVNAAADLIVGNASNSLNNTLLADGSNAVLNVAGDWIAGNYGDGSTATIRTGAVVNVTSNVWLGRHSDNNWIYITGSNTSLNAGGDLFIGQTASTGNQFVVFNGANVGVGGNLELAGSGSLLWIDSLSTVAVTGDYYQAAGTRLQIGLNTNEASLTVGGAADFDAGSGIYVDTTGYGDDAITTNDIQATIVSAGILQINGTNASIYGLGLLDVDLSALFVNSLTEFNAYITNNAIVVDNFTELPISDTLELTGSAAAVGDIVDGLAQTDPIAQSMRDILDGLSVEKAAQAMNDHYGEKESANPIHTEINGAVGGFAKTLFGRQRDVRSRMGMEDAGYALIGASPDTNQYQQVQGWAQGFGSWASRNEDGGYYGYDASTYGTVIGFDLIVNDRMLFGAAGGYSTSDVEKDNDATGEASSRHAAMYTSIAGDEWFFDGGLIFASSSIDQDFGDIFGTTASYDAQNVAAHLGAGREMVGQYFVVTPEAGVLVNYYDQDAYTEKSTDALPRDVDGFDALYIQSSLGGSVGMYVLLGEKTVRTELRAHWLHEFNADEEDLSYTVANDPQRLTMTLQAPEKDVLRIGAGVAMQLSEYLEFRMDANAGGSGEYYQYDLSGTLRYQF